GVGRHATTTRRYIYAHYVTVYHFYHVFISTQRYSVSRIAARTMSRSLFPSLVFRYYLGYLYCRAVTCYQSIFPLRTSIMSAT
ncbi:uncharacterized protein EI90DRAFT_3078262, partial [Cantharellus anzutake]|uniref:uncharacterized protein n=1 Tax=Cantharellus anzutake TaxID=1750568 RepID=UPI0019038BAE